MSFSTDQIKQLESKLDRANVKTREQAGRSLSYIEAYHAENEANRIFGFDAWDRFTELTLISEVVVGDKHRVYYRAKVRIIVRTPGGGTVTREGCGYGSGIDKDLGQAHESALKEAESDAEKRALKTFGNPFGQALYDKSQADVETVVSAAAVAALASIDLCKTPDDLDRWAENNGAAVRAMADDEARMVRAKFSAKRLSIKDAA